MTPWRNTWVCGPGAAQAVYDEIELGPRVSIPWASGRAGCVTDLTGPDRLARLDPAPPPHYPRRPRQPALFATPDVQETPC